MLAHFSVCLKCMKYFESLDKFYMTSSNSFKKLDLLCKTVYIIKMDGADRTPGEFLKITKLL